MVVTLDESVDQGLWCQSLVSRTSLYIIFGHHTVKGSAAVLLNVGQWYSNVVISHGVQDTQGLCHIYKSVCIVVIEETLSKRRRLLRIVMSYFLSSILLPQLLLAFKRAR